MLTCHQALVFELQGCIFLMSNKLLNYSFAYRMFRHAGKPLDPAKPIVRRARYVVGEFIAEPSHKGQ